MNRTNTMALEKRRGILPQCGGDVHHFLGFGEDESGNSLADDGIERKNPGHELV